MLPISSPGGALLILSLIFTVASSYVRRYDNDLADDFAREIKDFQKRLDMAYAERCGALSIEAQKWMERTDGELGRRSGQESMANWNYVTNMTEENSGKLEAVMAGVDDWLLNMTEKAMEYLRHPYLICNATTRRLLRLFTHLSSVPIAKNLQTRRQLTRLGTEMQQIYATTSVTRNGKTYRLDPELNDIMAKSRDYNELLWAWGAWHDTVGRKLKDKYAELVDKMNEAARDNGYSNIGIYWQLTDFDQDDIESEMDRLYEELRPFYERLHAYVRNKLSRVYPSIDKKGYIPAHLLGNMWAQEWGEIYDILLPFPNASSNVNITKSMLDKGYTAQQMFRVAEEFFTSIGLEPMTSDFWSKSVIVRPADNTPMECHASAEEFYTQTDFRIKMCTEVNPSDFQTVHHEMGHIEYFMLYRHQPTVFRTGANAAFHEAIGDTIALSVMTDTHLGAIGLMDETTSESYEQRINFLMKMALRKIAFIPYAYVLDKWRFKVFRGEIEPDNYTSSYWNMREYYQGISAPKRRTKDDFDPGAKYHVPANVGYSRYFFSFIGQFQFHSALCKLAGHKGPLHTCDIYRSKKAGEKLRSVLSLGASRPWPDVLREFTGQSHFRVNAILEYFKPLIDFLKQANKNSRVGWRKRRVILFE